MYDQFPCMRALPARGFYNVGHSLPGGLQLAELQLQSRPGGAGAWHLQSFIVAAYVTVRRQTKLICVTGERAAGDDKLRQHWVSCVTALLTRASPTLVRGDHPLQHRRACGGGCRDGTVMTRWLKLCRLLRSSRSGSRTADRGLGFTCVSKLEWHTHPTTQCPLGTLGNASEIRSRYNYVTDLPSRRSDDEICLGGTLITVLPERTQPGLPVFLCALETWQLGHKLRRSIPCLNEILRRPTCRSNYDVIDQAIVSTEVH